MVDDNLNEHRYMLFNCIESYYEGDFKITLIEDDTVVIENKVAREAYLVDKTKNNAVVKLPYGFDICKINNDDCANKCAE